MENRQVMNIETQGEVSQQDLNTIAEKFQAAEVPAARGESKFFTPIDELAFVPDANVGDSTINAAAVAAQTASLTLESRESVQSAVDAPASDEMDGRIRLAKDEEWRREGNNKKFTDPAKAKRVKKIAAASRRRNRRS